MTLSPEEFARVSAVLVPAVAVVLREARAGGLDARVAVKAQFENPGDRIQLMARLLPPPDPFWPDKIRYPLLAEGGLLSDDI
jgi:hypothetical protein